MCLRELDQATKHFRLTKDQNVSEHWVEKAPHLLRKRCQRCVAFSNIVRGRFDKHSAATLKTNNNPSACRLGRSSEQFQTSLANFTVDFQALEHHDRRKNEKRHLLEGWKCVLLCTSGFGVASRLSEISRQLTSFLMLAATGMPALSQMAMA